MVGSLILRGIVVGLLAGLLAFAFAWAFGEPSVDLAIEFEEQLAAEAVGQPPEPEEPPIVSRGVQSSIGLLTGTAILGAGLGGIFAVLFAFSNGRIPGLGPQQVSALLAFLAFVAVSLVPWLKYPANPPASTFDDTVQLRTAAYFLMLAISIAAVIGAWVLRSRLIPRYGTWNASLWALGAYVVVIAAFYVALPTINETPADFPAVVLWDFRLASLGIQVVLWATLGLVFGYVVERTLISQSPTSLRHGKVSA